MIYNIYMDNGIYYLNPAYLFYTLITVVQDLIRDTRREEQKSSVTFARVLKQIAEKHFTLDDINKIAGTRQSDKEWDHSVYSRSKVCKIVNY